MPKLKPVSGLKLIKALGKAGFQVVGKKGSHVRLKRKTATSFNIVIVPMHPEIKKGTLKSILRQADLTEKDLIVLLED
ncbi:MAG: type II toxin-antitoxin system HicA family toxin [Candidatus Bathyarchaeota archaeon]|nr:type II toxin-antitoxin system HicA family toxin [Candidatus Bathyarchaeota archaeon]